MTTAKKIDHHHLLLRTNPLKGEKKRIGSTKCEGEWMGTRPIRQEI
jgi:hypothetical protein